ncbi:unnamed protein product [Vitrella brassicaformis CCMP3155]|uniref:Uncharacterized protein n=2 Tax=Vitrella brassicaformis TaxID=1169539 RepID=A0A0G4EXR3_VITBC|nr:unnamed protein product [Vitrella brassicaformis CCMP3155]|eukprot:CEM03190.1 unnamed protein product [Vitrella brassicaformis CCMP3155]
MREKKRMDYAGLENDSDKTSENDVIYYDGPSTRSGRKRKGPPPAPPRAFVATDPLMKATYQRPDDYQELLSAYHKMIRLAKQHDLLPVIEPAPNPQFAERLLTILQRRGRVVPVQLIYAIADMRKPEMCEHMEGVIVLLEEETPISPSPSPSPSPRHTDTDPSPSPAVSHKQERKPPGREERDVVGGCLVEVIEWQGERVADVRCLWGTGYWEQVSALILALTRCFGQFPEVCAAYVNNHQGVKQNKHTKQALNFTGFQMWQTSPDWMEICQQYFTARGTAVTTGKPMPDGTLIPPVPTPPQEPAELPVPQPAKPRHRPPRAKQRTKPPARSTTDKSPSRAEGSESNTLVGGDDPSQLLAVPSCNTPTAMGVPLMSGIPGESYGRMCGVAPASVPVPSDPASEAGDAAPAPPSEWMGPPPQPMATDAATAMASPPGASFPVAMEGQPPAFCGLDKAMQVCGGAGEERVSEELSSSVPCNLSPSDIPYTQGMTLRIGNKGRARLLQLIREHRQTHRAETDVMMQQAGLQGLDLRRASIPQLLQCAHLFGVWDVAVQIHIDHIINSSASPTVPQRQPSPDQGMDRDTEQQQHQQEQQPEAEGQGHFIAPDTQQQQQQQEQEQDPADQMAASPEPSAPAGLPFQEIIAAASKKELIPMTTPIDGTATSTTGRSRRGKTSRLRGGWSRRKRRRAEETNRPQLPAVFFADNQPPAPTLPMPTLKTETSPSPRSSPTRSTGGHGHGGAGRGRARPTAPRTGVKRDVFTKMAEVGRVRGEGGEFGGIHPSMWADVSPEDMILSRKRFVGETCGQALRNPVHIFSSSFQTDLTDCFLLRDGVQWYQQRVSTALIQYLQNLVIRHFSTLLHYVGQVTDVNMPFKYNSIACRGTTGRIDVNLSHTRHIGELGALHEKILAAFKGIEKLFMEAIKSEFQTWPTSEDHSVWRRITLGYIMSRGPHQHDQKYHNDYFSDLDTNIVTGFVPLVDITETNSGTEFKIPGSARGTVHSRARMGDVILMDNLTRHRGTRHIDASWRPLIYLSFCDKPCVGKKTHDTNWGNYPPLHSLKDPNLAPNFPPIEQDMPPECIAAAAAATASAPSVGSLDQLMGAAGQDGQSTTAQTCSSPGSVPLHGDDHAEKAAAMSDHSHTGVVGGGAPSLPVGMAAFGVGVGDMHAAAVASNQMVDEASSTAAAAAAAVAPAGASFVSGVSPVSSRATAGYLGGVSPTEAQGHHVAHTGGDVVGQDKARRQQEEQQQQKEDDQMAEGFIGAEPQAKAS